MIKKPQLKTKDAVEIPSPSFKDGSTIVPDKQPDMKNSETDLNQTASSENQSAKYKYPRVKQEVPEAGKGQYEAV